ncbi:MAG: tRNA (adenosine(37)-N6)-dimethylallyltransferase MiaA [Caldisericia bacterium]
MKKVVVIFGPTGVRKSEISVLLSKEIDGEVISFDAYQVYKYMDIGTNKIKKEDMQNIQHHLIDIVMPNEEFSAGLYKELAEKKIDEVLKKNKIPVLVGGTGLYMRTLLYFEPPKKDEKIREILNKKLEDVGLEELFSELKKFDPLYASKINKNDKKRILRALEVYYIYKKPFSEFLKEEEKYDAIKFGIIMERKILYKKLEERIERMFKDGFIDEVKFIKENFGFSNTSIKAIGYETILQYLIGDINLDDCKKIILKKTKEYARRQLIWMKKEKDIRVIDRTDKDDNIIVNEIKEYIKKIWKIL